MTREKINDYQKRKRQETNNIYTKKYEKTKNGFLMRTYRNMLSRISGVQRNKHHLYKNKILIEKHSFYEWSLNNINFNELFSEWEKNNYNRKLTPSIDRIDSSRGYEINNIQWITHSENSKKGGLWRKNIALTNIKE